VHALTGPGRELDLVEPDDERALAAAGAVARVTPAPKRWSVHRTDAATFAAACSYPYDVVVCSHVLQHVETGERASLLQALAQLIRPGGRVLVTFSSTGTSSERYLVSRHTHDGVRTHVVTASEFDDVARGSQAGAAGVALPVWHARTEDVSSAATSAGLFVLEVGAYRAFTYCIEEEGKASYSAMGCDAFLIATVRGPA
jgi:predicted SAM-dependent methyltransferase